MIFESQYLGLRTSLPPDPNLYGLGEHTDLFRLNTTNYTQDALVARCLWYSIWNQPVWQSPSLRGSSRRKTARTVFLFMNSNGMDIKINDTAGQYLEYNTMGGVFDFYFFAGPSPVEVAQQISEVVGLPAMMSYWTFGYHQCRYGYRDVYDVAEVVYNYSQGRDSA